jgi:hypothetical protein
VAFTEFRIDPATATAPFQLYSAPFSLTEGIRFIEFRGQDNAGNVETAKSGYLYVDGTAPITDALTAGATGQNGWYVSTVAVALAAEDNMSGVAAVFYGLTRISADGAEVILSSGIYVAALPVNG